VGKDPVGVVGHGTVFMFFFRPSSRPPAPLPLRCLPALVALGTTMIVLDHRAGRPSLQ
jgi:hypothetical protein